MTPMAASDMYMMKLDAGFSVIFSSFSTERSLLGTVPTPLASAVLIFVVPFDGGFDVAVVDGGGIYPVVAVITVVVVDGGGIPPVVAVVTDVVVDGGCVGLEGGDGAGRDGAGRDGAGLDGGDGAGRDGAGRDGAGLDGGDGAGRDGAGRDGAGLTGPAVTVPA